jgi:ribosomal protein S18 acetylase RimI-like enzyme
MSSIVAVRDLGEADLESLLSLYRHLHQNDDPLPEQARVVEIWSAIVRDASHLYLGAFVNESLVSACNAAVVPNLTRGARPYAVIENVVTDENFRRRGIGSQVLRALLERCWKRRCYKVMLMSGVGRAEVYAFYESLGFERNAKQAFVMVAP